MNLNEHSNVHFSSVNCYWKFFHLNMHGYIISINLNKTCKGYPLMCLFYLSYVYPCKVLRPCDKTVVQLKVLPLTFIDNRGLYESLISQLRRHW